jgi:hypothetical protein
VRPLADGEPRLHAREAVVRLRRRLLLLLVAVDVVLPRRMTHIVAGLRLRR